MSDTTELDKTHETDPAIAAADFTEFARMGHTVMWHDQPIMAWFRSDAGDLLAMRTIDRDGEPYHFIAIVMEGQDLTDYLSNKIDLRDLMTREDASLHVINYNAEDKARAHHYGIRPLGTAITEDDLPGAGLFWIST
jgi:hypothetical protein